MTRTGSAAASVRLTFGRLVAYSTNQLPLNMAALPVVLNVSHFYGEVLKVPLGIMGLIFIAARVIDVDLTGVFLCAREGAEPPR